MVTQPLLDKSFLPAAEWNRIYRKKAEASGKARPFRIALQQPSGQTVLHETLIEPGVPINFTYVERLLKFLLWQGGGSQVLISDAPELAAELQQTYRKGGARAFDAEQVEKIYAEALRIESVPLDAVPEQHLNAASLGGHLDGCRIGFDLGGSDRKCAALVDGEVVFSEEIRWDPYFEKDPQYHVDGIRDSLRRAAEHLPRVDAIGGSAAGVYVDNVPRIASLFRAVSPADFKAKIQPLFKQLGQEWGVPFEVVNDGDVTALAGALSFGEGGVLGASLGTSFAAGYVDREHHLTNRLNELAFVPVDYRAGAPLDEWSGDRGCGVQYFSQQAVARLIPASGLEVDASLAFPDQLLAVQEAMTAGDSRAAAIYRTIGVYLGHTLAHFAEFYDIRSLLLLGRVTSGEGGSLIIDETRRVLDQRYPELAKGIRIRTPDEKDKRHGQAIAAASLPRLSQGATT